MKSVKKGIQITIISLVLISFISLSAIYICKTPNIFCQFISWLGHCEEETICTEKSIIIK